MGMTEAQQFFAKVAQLQPTEAAQNAKAFQLRAQWEETAWARTADEGAAAKFAVFALAAVSDNTNAVASIQTASGDLARDNSGAIPPGRVQEYVKVLVTTLVAADVPPPDDAASHLEEELEENDEQDTSRTNGLKVNPIVFVNQLLMQRRNVGSAQDADSDNSDDDTSADSVWRNRLVGRGRKKSAKLLPETLSMMPESMCISRSLGPDEKKHIIELLRDNQVSVLHDSVAHAQGLPNPTRATEFLSFLRGMQVSAEESIKQVERTAAEQRKQMKSDRKEANILVVAGDMIRRLVAAHNTNDVMEEADLLQAEQFAAIATRLGAQKLQEASTVTANKFCAAFGIAQTEEIERLISDPTMMEPQRRRDVRRELVLLISPRIELSQRVRVHVVYLAFASMFVCGDLSSSAARLQQRRLHHLGPRPCWC